MIKLYQPDNHLLLFQFKMSSSDEMFESDFAHSTSCSSVLLFLFYINLYSKFHYFLQLIDKFICVEKS